MCVLILHDDLAFHMQNLNHMVPGVRIRILRKCFSGGVGFELGSTFIKQGYKVYGVRYSAEESG